MESGAYYFANWHDWLDGNISSLRKGVRLVIPEHLPHPAQITGFRQIALADSVGQLKDWGYSLNDGSRIHIHEYSDGTLVVHRDRIDPSRGLINAMAHWAFESKSGQFILVGLMTLGFGWIFLRR